MSFPFCNPFAKLLGDSASLTAALATAMSEARSRLPGLRTTIASKVPNVVAKGQPRAPEMIGRNNDSLVAAARSATEAACDQIHRYQMVRNGDSGQLPEGGGEGSARAFSKTEASSYIALKRGGISSAEAAATKSVSDRIAFTLERFTGDIITINAFLERSLTV